jgi:hypothetical protein
MELLNNNLAFLTSILLGLVFVIFCNAIPLRGETKKTNKTDYVGDLIPKPKRKIAWIKIVWNLIGGFFLILFGIAGILGIITFRN